MDDCQGQEMALCEPLTGTHGILNREYRDHSGNPKMIFCFKRKAYSDESKYARKKF